MFPTALVNTVLEERLEGCSEAGNVLLYNIWAWVCKIINGLCCEVVLMSPETETAFFCPTQSEKNNFLCGQSKYFIVINKEHFHGWVCCDFMGLQVYFPVASLNSVFPSS